MVGPAWGGTYIYKCPAGMYAAGGELKSTANCSAGFSNSNQVVYKIPSVGKACTSCPKVHFLASNECIDISGKFCTKKNGVIKCGFKYGDKCLAGTTNPNRYRPAVQKNCYVPGGSKQYEDETGYFTLSGNCYYTGGYQQ